MSPGKIAVQVAHATTEVTINVLTNDTHEHEQIMQEMFWEWYRNGQKKIVLRASQKEIEKFINQYRFFFPIRDMGLTEIPEGSLTCIGLGVMTREMAQEYIKRLQLL